jgi:hypothetical protein
MERCLACEADRSVERVEGVKGERREVTDAGQPSRKISGEGVQEFKKFKEAGQMPVERALKKGAGKATCKE